MHNSAFKISPVLLYGLVAVLLGACGEVTDSSDHRFVALDAVFDEQVKLLESLNPPVRKTVLTAGGEETQVFRDIDWQKELAAFRLADLSKPGLRGAYAVRETAPNVRVFRVKPGEKGEVQELRVEFTADNRVKSILTLVNDKNYLYHTRRTLRVEFAPQGDHWLIRRYQIDGFQKLLGSSQKPFAVRAETL